MLALYMYRSLYTLLLYVTAPTVQATWGLVPGYRC
jgi:hypothetical protein